MVYYSEKAQHDLTEIFWGLINWPKHPLEFNHASAYLDDIHVICNNLDKTNYHANVQFEIHKKYGKKVFNYTRNKNTTWYIIYDIDVVSNTIYIQHITSNHITITGKE